MLSRDHGACVVSLQSRATSPKTPHIRQERNPRPGNCHAKQHRVYEWPGLLRCPVLGSFGVYLVKYDYGVSTIGHDCLSDHHALYGLGLHSFGHVYNQKHHVHDLSSADDGANKRGMPRAIDLRIDCARTRAVNFSTSYTTPCLCGIFSASLCRNLRCSLGPLPSTVQPPIRVSRRKKVALVSNCR